ncbi:hypothetical protein KJ786_00930 [Patescibacteria group bacterium]|nr:hypothetical protein [Patescibacteria group bacterium]
MKYNIFKKINCSIFVWGFLIICLFSFFCFNFCSAANLPLEIKYPELPTGEALSDMPELPTFLLYLYNFGIWFGFLITILALIVAGVFYLLSNVFPSLKVSAKDRFRGALTGFLLILFTYLIATTINPALSVFEIQKKLKEPPKLPEEGEPAGVYFYDKPGCFSTPVGYSTSSINDFGDYKNKIKSVKIVDKWEKTWAESTVYMAILFDVINFQGNCLWVFPVGCDSDIDTSASSAAIYQETKSPTGNGVTFYRKPYHDKNGGWYTIKNSELKNVYVASLDELQFKDVPIEEQVCIKWDIKNKCIERKPPTLDGQNIGSIEIDGSYVVLFITAEPPKNPEKETFGFCQLFPTPNDINKEGPKQIKWEVIQNQKWLPLIVVIFPVVNN